MGTVRETQEQDRDRGVGGGVIWEPPGPAAGMARRVLSLVILLSSGMVHARGESETGRWRRGNRTNWCGPSGPVVGVVGVHFPGGFQIK
jgi:phosphoglycerate dehydrogenase-like enzyme